MTDLPPTDDPLRELETIMARLRAPEGCPWDREQTLKTLRPYVIEEAYEVVDAIDSGDDDVHCEELGDLLLQIVFQAQIARERGAFTLDDVARSICDKMTRRHPHVFADGEAVSAEEVEVQWEAIKAKEGKRALSGVPRALPALRRAIRVTEKASRVGFDWEFSHQVLDKVEEESAELRVALQQGVSERIEEEVGDLLFALANFARHVGVDPEDALRGTIDRFTARFEHVESELLRRNAPLGEVPLEELDRLWEIAKSALKEPPVS